MTKNMEFYRMLFSTGMGPVEAAAIMGVSKQRASQIRRCLIRAGELPGQAMGNTRPGRWKAHAGRPDPRPSVRARAKPRKFYETERVA